MKPTDPVATPGDRQHASGRPGARLSSGRAVLAVCRSAGAADRGGARRAQSGTGRGALRGSPKRPFSISIEFPRFDGPDYARAVEMARRVGGVSGDRLRRDAAAPCAILSRRRGQAARVCSRSSAASTPREVLIDDRPVPYARELWLPLLWFLIR